MKGLITWAKIVKITRDFTDVERLKLKNSMLIKDKDSAINGKPTYARIAIRKK